MSGRERVAGSPQRGGEVGRTLYREWNGSRVAELLARSAREQLRLAASVPLPVQK